MLNLSCSDGHLGFLIGTDSLDYQLTQNKQILGSGPSPIKEHSNGSLFERII